MEKLRGYAAANGIELSDKMLGQFEEYLRLLLDWNSRINLTAITDREEVQIKHFLDSLLLLSAVPLPEGAAVIDIGTGAGFPGIPLKVVRGDLQLTLLDSLRKRVNFLEEVSAALGQHNKCVHGRAEELARQENYRERYDLATARAVAALPALCEYCLPFVRVGGHFVALKGWDVEEEAERAQRAVELLGGELREIRKLELPQGNRRSLVVINKRSQTPTKYPRAATKVTKSPL